MLAKNSQAAALQIDAARRCSGAASLEKGDQLQEYKATYL